MDQNNNYEVVEAGPEEYNVIPASTQDPVSFGQWMVTLLLMVIPIVNIVMLIMWITSPETQPSKKNWAKAQVIFIIVGTVLSFTISAAVRTMLFGVLGGLF